MNQASSKESQEEVIELLDSEDENTAPSEYVDSDIETVAYGENTSAPSTIQENIQSPSPVVPPVGKKSLRTRRPPTNLSCVRCKHSTYNLQAMKKHILACVLSMGSKYYQCTACG